MNLIFNNRTADKRCINIHSWFPWQFNGVWIFGIVFIGFLLYGLPSPTKGEQFNNSFILSKRFIDRGDNTVSDTQTGLMWIKQDSFLHKKKWMNWFDAHKYVENLNKKVYANYSDWRVPELEELKTLYEKDKLNSAQVGREMKIHIDPIFAKEGSGSLWSSKANGRFNAYGIIFNDGKKFSHAKKSKTRKAVRAVRYDLQ